jgi:ElaB/YqjD/DUF883 family membrane-anchored ribosome-binding protein
MDATAKGTSDFRATANGEIRAFLADVEELLERVGDNADAEVGRLRLKLTDTLADLRRTYASFGLRDRARMAADRARAAAEMADDYVRDRPWTAIGLTAALALLVGAGVGVATRR